MLEFGHWLELNEGLGRDPGEDQTDRPMYESTEAMRRI